MSSEQVIELAGGLRGDGAGGLRSGVCWWLECAACGIEWAEAYDGLPHYDSPEGARKALFDSGEGPDRVGFTTRGDGRVLCRGCSEAADCAEDGHDYALWRARHDDEQVEYRYCEHCGGAFQERLTALGGGGLL